MKKNVVIYGKGDFAKLIFYFLENDSSYKVIAFCVDEEYLDSDTFCGKSLISFNEIDEKYPCNLYKAFVAIGYSNMRIRKVMYEKIKKKGYSCINYLSSKASISENMIIGENNVILANSVIEPFVEIGNNNIIWSSSNICHDVKIFSHCFLASQSLVGGFSIIKDNSFLGFNCTILQNLTVEKESLIGSNSLLLSNTEQYSKYLGNPAKMISKHEKEGIRIK